MPVLSKRQQNHVAKVIRTKREKLFRYPGGNRTLAEKVGVSAQAVSKWVHNKLTPKDSELFALAEVFGISIDELCPAGVKRTRTASASGASERAARDDARESMLKICDITAQLVRCQRQMLTGMRDARQHKAFLKRIQNYLNAL